MGAPNWAAVFDHKAVVEWFIQVGIVNQTDLHGIALDDHIRCNQGARTVSTLLQLATRAVVRLRVERWEELLQICFNSYVTTQ